MCVRFVGSKTYLCISVARKIYNNIRIILNVFQKTKSACLSLYTLLYGIMFYCEGDVRGKCDVECFSS